MHDEYITSHSLDLCHCQQKGPYYRDRVPIGTFFGVLGPYWASIYISGSLFSVFWLHLREECQFSLHVYNNELSWSVCDEQWPALLLYIYVQACDFVGYYVIYVNLLKIEVIYVILFLEVIMLFSWKGGVNFYISLWNAKIDYIWKNSRRWWSRKIKACNKSKQSSCLFIDQWPGEDTNTWTNPI